MNKIKVMTLALLLAGGGSWLSGCSDDNDGGQSVLLRPVTTMELEQNKATLSWKAVEGATEYIVEVYLIAEAGDELYKTETIPAGQTSCVVTLDWENNYKFKVRAIGGNRESGYWETDATGILVRPLAIDLKQARAIDTKARISWVPNDTVTITALTVVANTTGENAEAEVKTYPVTAEEYTAGYKDIDNLSPETSYRVNLYSGEEQTPDTYQARLDINTVAAEDLDAEFGANLVRVPAGNPNYFATIDWSAVPEGTAYALPGGQIFTVLEEAMAFSSSVTFVTELSLEDNATFVTSTMTPFVFAEGAHVNSLTFKRVGVKADADLSTSADKGNGFSGKYVMCPEKVFTAGEISFIDCSFENFRGLVRSKVTGSVIAKLTFEGCDINGVGGYTLVSDDNKDNRRFDEIVINNCTLRNVWGGFSLQKSNNCQSITISNSTLCYAPATSGTFFSLADGVSVNIENCVFGASMAVDGKNAVFNTAGAGGADCSKGRTYASTGSYKASDRSISKGNLSLTDAKLDTKSLFTNAAVGDFTLNANFAGASSAGALKWRK